MLTYYKRLQLLELKSKKNQQAVAELAVMYYSSVKFFLIFNFIRLDYPHLTDKHSEHFAHENDALTMSEYFMKHQYLCLNVTGITPGYQ